VILASRNGLLCAVKLIRETDKAWIIQYAGEKKKETRVSKNGDRKMFGCVSDAERWVFTGAES
jgi:hypothetical protein